MPLPLHLWLVHPDQEMCNAFHQHFNHLPNITIIQGLFEDLPPHDCFVTAANAFGIMTAGIDAAVIQLHGEQLMERVQHRIRNKYLGEQPIGTCFIEATGNPDYPFLAHAPTMRLPGIIAGTGNVYAATWGALLSVYRHNVEMEEQIRTVVFPAMGTGYGNVPFEEAARQMAVAYQHYLEPPHRLDWEFASKRQHRINYNGKDRMIR